MATPYRYNPFIDNYQYLPLKMPDYRYLVYGCLDVDPPKKIEPVYRILEEGEKLQAGDEIGFLGEKRPCWSKMSAVGENEVARRSVLGPPYGSEYQYRRPVRMQDVTHRYLDVGEMIVDGDDYYNELCKEWFPTFAAPRTVGSLKGNLYTFGEEKVLNIGVRYRRPFTAKPELNKLPDDPNYFYLKAGEYTKAGDEVLIQSFDASRWEKVKNGNIDAIVSKTQADMKCYRRKVDHKELSDFKSDYSVDYFSKMFSICRINELTLEVNTLKDQLANAMAEINELKASREPRYRILQVDDFVEAGDEIKLASGRWVPSLLSHYPMDESSVGRFRRKIG
jgi:hypothetical protein